MNNPEKDISFTIPLDRPPIRRVKENPANRGLKFGPKLQTMRQIRGAIEECDREIVRQMMLRAIPVAAAALHANRLEDIAKPGQQAHVVNSARDFAESEQFPPLKDMPDFVESVYGVMIPKYVVMQEQFYIERTEPIV